MEQQCSLAQSILAGCGVSSSGGDGGCELSRKHCHMGSWGRGWERHSSIRPSMISCSVDMVRRIRRHDSWQCVASARSQQYRPGGDGEGVNSSKCSFSYKTVVRIVKVT